MKQYTATANDDGVRLSRFVQSVTRDFPTSLLYKSFRNKRVKVNGKKSSITIKKLKSGKRYYIQVRAVKKNGTAVKKGAWSTKKSVRVK